MLLKIHATGRIFGKICLKDVKDTFFPLCCLWTGEGWGETWRKRGGSVFWWEATSNRSGVQNFGHEGKTPLQVPPLVENPDLPIRKNLRSVLGLLAVMILKRVSIFFQGNKFTACKVKDGKGVAKSLMVFNLLKIIQSFQCKKYLGT